MLWIFLMIPLVIIAVVGFAIGKGLPLVDSNGYNGFTKDFKRLVSWGSVVGTAILALLATVVMSINAIPSGHVGVVRSFGNIDGQIPSGLQFVAPWKSVNVADVQVQRYNVNLAAFSSETQDVFANVSVNYHVSPNAIQGLYANVGSDYFNTLVVPRVNQIFKDTAVQYAAVEIAPNREQIRAAVRDKLKAALKPYSIDVVDVLINNLHFSAQFTQAIEQKQIQTQDSLKAQQKVQQAKFEAQQVVATSQGQAQATLVQAQGQAKANRVLTHSLSPLLVEYQAIQKFNPNVQIALVPSGKGSLLDPSAFLRGLQPK